MTNTVSTTVTDEELDSIIQIESSGNPMAKAATSSALGLGQFLNATWLSTVRRSRADVMNGRTQTQVLAMRTNASFSIEMLARFTEANKRSIGANAAPGDLYLAHFLGAGTAAALFRAPAGAPVSTVVSAEAIRANKSILQDKSCGQVRAWAESRMKKSGGHGWVKKYYKPTQRMTVEEAAPEPVAPVDQGDTDTGDADLRETQRRLLGMHYRAGEPDGAWGGMTAGAISGFINDRGGFIPAPTSYDQYQEVRDRIELEIDKAEAENFKRPVTVERDTADFKTVAKVAPEAVPARRSWIGSLWASIVATVTGIVTTGQGYILQGWNWFTNNRDSLPDSATDPGTIMAIIHRVPPGVWILLIGVAFGVLAFLARSTMKKITDPVTTGVRQ